jgi:hypothetical protein
MASGKRAEGESFEDYKDRLGKEAKALKHKLKGRWAWLSAIIAPDTKKLGAFRKLKVRGTYVKPKQGKENSN